MDDLIKQTLTAKAQEIDVPASVWQRVQQETSPAGRPGIWKRYRLGRGVEIAGAVAILLLLVLVGTLRQSPGSPATTPSETHVSETAIATSQTVGDDLLRLRDLAPVDPDSSNQAESEQLRMEMANQALKPFGYRLEQTGAAYTLYQGDRMVLSGFSNFSPVSASSRQDDFIFMAFVPADRYWLVRAAGAEEWDPTDVMRYRFQAPVYVGNDLVAVRWDDQSQGYVVERGGQPVFTVPLETPAFGDEVKRLVSWNGHWVLEVKGDVYIDGKSLRQEHRYDEVFQWRLIDGRPFYFFRQGEQIGLAYDDHVLPYHYEQVPHNLCCEPSVLNPQGAESGVKFFGLRQGTWYWVRFGSR